MLTTIPILNENLTNLESSRGVLWQRSGLLLVDSSAGGMTTTSLFGTTDGGTQLPVPVTSEGHLEVEIHGPRNPFGSIHVENLLPIFQVDAVYGVNTQLCNVTTGLGGYLFEENSQFVMQSNTSVGGNATLQSKRRLRYRPGQGAVARFTAGFTTGVSLGVQVAGIGHPEDGLYFGYNGTQFGVLHSYAGIREQQTLTLTGHAVSAGNINIVLNGTANSIPVTTTTSPLKTAYDISTGVYPGWSAQIQGSGVVFLANSVGNKTNPFLISGGATACGGSFAKTRSGAALTENWIYQTGWNGDKLDGSGASAVTLDPTKGNVYQIGYQYLGYGALTFQVETVPEGNNADWVTVHSVSYPNNYTTPSFRNPAFPFTASTYSLGTTTSQEVKVGSFAGFIEGQKVLNGPQFTYTATLTDVSTTYRPIFTILNNYVYKGKSNQCVVNLQSINAALKHTQPASVFIFKNANLGGNPNFSAYSNDSCTSYDTAATSLTIDDNEQLLFSFSLGEAGQASFDLKNVDIVVEPGETITVAGNTKAGTAAFFSASINTREDQ